LQIAGRRAQGFEFGFERSHFRRRERALIGLGRSLNIVTTAEGVET